MSKNSDRMLTVFKVLKMKTIKNALLSFGILLLNQVLVQEVGQEVGQEVQKVQNQGEPSEKERLLKIQH